ncbi:hypothetical protein GCM10009557_65630 [Virgisporangium ochraceum]|uniref:MEDS domain-containing protein n=1 Tax=Virgisporangium ochraceum TaxID=65505 RepID=A0A8J4A2I4_9ACTN|nr:MEDS domain-containing protein [Virgisporangium ochraceum]GIJ73387.1 hypothetical protein Voc01_083040 [Virgisporangium ochraceum]
MTAVIDARHSCWSYDDPRPFDEFTRGFLGAGLSAGARVWYIPGRVGDAVTDWLHAQAAASARPDTVRVVAPENAYAAVDPALQVDAWAAAADDALAAGFTGLRVVADVTDLVRTDEQREAFARYEWAIGRFLRTAPVRGVCAYDRRELGDRVVAGLACLHEVVHGGGVTFRLHSGPTPAVAVLDGEVDQTAEELFAAALGHTDLEPVGGEVTVDADGLRFIDHRSMLVLERYAQSRHLTAVVRTRLGTAARLAGLLDLSHVRVELGP